MAAMGADEVALDRRGADLRLFAARSSVAVATTLVALKVGAVAVTGSVAILASLVDSLADLAASGLTWFSVRHAQRPPDADHRFGHGKAEALSSLVQSGLIAGSALFVVGEAWRSLGADRPVEATELGVAIMAISLLLTGALIAIQRRVVAATGSLAIRGDLAHYTTDLVSAAAVAGTLLVERWAQTPWIDPAVGALIAVYLLFTAWSIGRESVDQLMDRELPDDERDRIRSRVLEVDGVRGMHDLRTRAAGDRQFVELHLELDPELRLREAHRITERVITLLQSDSAGRDVIIHQDPQGVDERRLDDLVNDAERPR